MDKTLRAQLIKRAVVLGEQVAELLDLLMPDDGSECPHPPDKIEHEETMDDEPSEYRCTLCGATQDQPFHPE